MQIKLKLELNLQLVVFVSHTFVQRKRCGTKLSSRKIYVFLLVQRY